MKTILVATDFSPAAFNAAEYAVEMAGMLHANVMLLHVCQMPVTYGEAPAIVNEGDMINDAELELMKLKEQLQLKTGSNVEINTDVAVGLFFNELKRVCESISPYIVVMGCQGTSAADHLLLGSHAGYTVRHLWWPLITVPPGSKFGAIKKIGLACDLRNVLETTPVDEIKLLVHDFNAELHILNTGKQNDLDPDMPELGALKGMFIGLEPQYHFIINKDIDEGIMEYAINNNIDILLVLPKRHHLLDMLFHKSHTKNLVLHSHVPVMALHQ